MDHEIPIYRVSDIQIVFNFFFQLFIFILLLYYYYLVSFSLPKYAPSYAVGGEGPTVKSQTPYYTGDQGLD